MKPSHLTLAKIHDTGETNNLRLTVILIHGIASNAHTYDKALEYFGNNLNLDIIRFVSFDLLGSGDSYSGDDLEYNYDEQITALHNSIKALDIKTPIILVGHSLGTFIVTRYAHRYPDNLKRLILVSPPVYTEKDFANPAFTIGIDAFKKAVSLKNPKILREKSFNASMENIILKKDNYSVLAKITTPTIIVYGNDDQLIASYNIPALITQNPNITAHKTIGRHGVTHDKYKLINNILKEETNA